MGMGFLLALFINARPCMLHKVAHLPQAAITVDRMHRHTPASVVGGQQVAPGSVNTEVTRGRAVGGFLIEGGQGAAGRVNGKGRDRAIIVSATKITHFVDSIQVATVGVNGQVRRVLNAGCFTRHCQRPARRVHLQQINALTLGLDMGQTARIGAHVDVHRLSHSTAPFAISLLLSFKWYRLIVLFCN